MTTRPLRSIYQLKVTLDDVKPPVWRRVRIASSASLADLHLTLQIVMGWTDSHLHEFAKGRDHYGLPHEDSPAHTKDEKKFRLDQVLKKEMDKLRYTYDFGDGWEHEVVLEKILPFEPGAMLPVCLKGSRACPPEDVGGIPGYEMFLEAVSDLSHPEHEDMREWIGGDFEPGHFDPAEINHLLRRTKRVGST